MIQVSNPKASYLARRQAIDASISEVLESGRYILGKHVEEFEKNFADYIGTTDCIGVANGTDAIQFGLRALGIQPGDEVITVSFTSIATIAAIRWIGAIPTLVDIEPDSYSIDPQKVEDTLKSDDQNKIKAILAVHLYGYPADIDALLNIADRYGVYLLEDCAQSHGATINGRKTGSFSECGTFSFYPTKNLGAFGDGGAIVTSNNKLAKKMRSLQQYGWRERYISLEEGYNSRLDELQAAILNCKLRWLDEDNLHRWMIAQKYTFGLNGVPIILPKEKPGTRNVFHQYIIRYKNRDGLRKYLAELGIQTSILYPVPVHLQPGYSDKVKIGLGGLKETEEKTKEILSLPIYPELDESDIDKIIHDICSFFG